MNKNDVITAVATRTGEPKKNAEKMLDAMLDVIKDALASGDKVQFVGFGAFEVKEHEARQGHNPRTGETIEIAASKTPVFKPGKVLKDAVNK